MIDKKHGFTLVELSIVLVIVGLLIGGILIGQSLIESAKTVKFIREVDQYVIAINNFKTKYKQLPGDSDQFPDPGNHNNQIQYPGSGAIGEWTRLWTHLGQSGILQKSYSGVIPYTAGSAGVPESAVFKRGYYTVAWNIDNSRVHEIRFGYQNGPTQMNGYATITPIQAMAIDGKLDDGKPHSGKVKTVLYETVNPGCLTNTTGSGAPYATGEYNTANSANACGFILYQDF